MKLEDRVAVVTGGGRGIGRAICLAYAREGADLVVASNVAGENEAVADEVVSLGRKALPYELDVSDGAQVQAMAEAALAEFGRVDILVSNAGHPAPRPASLLRRGGVEAGHRGQHLRRLPLLQGFHARA